MPRAQLRRERAEDYVRRLATDTAAGQRLPTVVQMAHRAGVAPNTMLKAVHVLRDEGLLAVSQRSGIRATPGGASRAGDHISRRPAARPRRQMVVQGLTSDIQRMVFPPGSLLPATKELANRYGVSCPTLHTALRTVCEAGLVERCRRRYRVRRPVSEAGSGVVKLLGRADWHGELHPPTARTLGLLQSLEQECARNGLALSIVPCTHDGQALRAGGREYSVQAALDSAGPVLGAIVWTAGLTIDGLELVVQTLSSRGLPVALFDEGDQGPKLARFKRRGRTRVFCMTASDIPGRVVARFLMSLGHRRVAYFDHPGLGSWSHHRYLGVRGVFAQAGLPDAVTRCRLARPRADKSDERSVMSHAQHVTRYLAPLVKRARG
ncbi:MAG: GntR family transcriptional regulator, partial [Chitinivibrionales bacterium]|nr:GntR family transcriptional regulator [Chitinivibrionales bacterium]